MYNFSKQRGQKTWHNLFTNAEFRNLTNSTSSLNWPVRVNSKGAEWILVVTIGVLDKRRLSFTEKKQDANE